MLFRTSQQGLEVLAFLWCGAVLGVWYGVLYLLRKGGRVLTVVADLLFCASFFLLFSAVSVWCLRGVLEWYALLCCGFGFWLARATLGTVIEKMMDILFRFSYNLGKRFRQTRSGEKLFR